MDCNLARTEMIAYLKGELNSEQQQCFEEHLAVCLACRHEFEGARRLLNWTEAASGEGVVRAVEQVIEGAIRGGASDIHLEPQRDGELLVRQRVDGVLHEVSRFDSAIRHGIAHRIKMLADMNVAETRIPQDGRIQWKLDNVDYDMRVNCQVFIHGEGFVMRILDRSNVMLGLDKLGLYEDDLRTLREIAHEPMGLLILSGPTGSGKTTTAYSLLADLVSPHVKVLTVEDPVEYLLKGVNQVQVHKAAGLTFSSALRTFLRADPDIVYAGEVRDLETATVAVETAITGHLMIASLHTNDAMQTFIRLVDMGVEPFLISATMIGATAQRLVRKVCQACKTEVPRDELSPAMKYFRITEDDLRSHTIYRGQGCDVCRKTGYRGRTGIFEVLKVDKELGGMVVGRPPLQEIREAARAKGFMTMREDARRKVLDGITTPEEALRVLV